MTFHRRLLAMLAAVCLTLAGSPAVEASAAQRREAKRDAIDGMAKQAVLRLLSENALANELADHAVGYAVFDSFKVSLLLSGGGGVGVAVDNRTGGATYMKMGTGGIGLGLGGQSYQLVFLFDDAAAFRRFVDRGWHADASANAVAGTKGKNADASFTHGVAVFQLTHKGLMAQADVSGTRYWKSRRLNR